MMKKITKKAVNDFVKNELRTNDKWAVRALIRIYEFQTSDEKNTNTTNESNNVGFTGFDAELLSSFAKQYIACKHLSIRQMDIVKERIPKYWRQIINIAGGHDKFHRFMFGGDLFNK